GALSSGLDPAVLLPPAPAAWSVVGSLTGSGLESVRLAAVPVGAADATGVALSLVVVSGGRQPAIAEGRAITAWYRHRIVTPLSESWSAPGGPGAGAQGLRQHRLGGEAAPAVFDRSFTRLRFLGRSGPHHSVREMWPGCARKKCEKPALRVP